jgi:hypothetical protein
MSTKGRRFLPSESTLQVYSRLHPASLIMVPPNLGRFSRRQMAIGPTLESLQGYLQLLPPHLSTLKVVTPERRVPRIFWTYFVSPITETPFQDP